MRRRGILAATAAGALLARGLRPARAEETVDVLLVLAVDVSRSVDEEEARLQREGYYAALTDPEIIALIRRGMLGAIGVAYVEWSGHDWQRLVVPWTRIGSAEEAAAWVEALERHPPRAIGWTSISGAIDFSRRVLAEAPWQGMRRVIDISGDGDNNSGPPAEQARDRAVAEGIVINGLPIMNAPHPGMRLPLDEYYRRNVIGGPGAFVIPTEDFHGFARAVRRKLVLEIAGRRGPGGAPA
ncbi:DUF1194 domain-containing protein [Crenalkalicoccus roseus]|uniref:DUF1194 domain-containing protein n=1 Tax=Crenalkalicoccus roseus TaxID=1485588 RepID=UPI0010810F91|nr:DUF1194 domain-containing protein [Crenalkalicoccus roseus]